MEKTEPAQKVRKPTRTLSGVAPLAVMLPPRACAHGCCTYCPKLDSPQSYTPKSPVVMRAAKVKFSAYDQVRNRLESLREMGHSTDKVELIVMGGTFLSYPLDFQYNFIKECFDALNRKDSQDLIEAKKINETAVHRCVALCLETRPDVCSPADIKRMLEFGCTRVEIGVQNPDDRIYKLTKRGHTIKDVTLATQRLKKAGFKIGYHLMPGLPGTNLKKDLAMFKEIFKNPDYCPDQIKIYPCQVLKGSEVERDYLAGKYKPYTKEETRKLIIEIYKIVPRYCRIMRVMREIPLDYLIAGILNMDLRKDIEEEIRKRKLKIKEIRFREIGFAMRDNRRISKDLKIKKVAYSASGGKEIFFEAVNKEGILFGLLRLRLEKDKARPAMIRELHVYGPTVELGKKDGEKFQHKGLGKQLMESAEKIAKEKKYKSMRVISGVGVREYYEKLGYFLDNEEYMSKDL